MLLCSGIAMPFNSETSSAAISPLHGYDELFARGSLKLGFYMMLQQRGSLKYGYADYQLLTLCTRYLITTQVYPPTRILKMVNRERSELSNYLCKFEIPGIYTYLRAKRAQ